MRFVAPIATSFGTAAGGTAAQEKPPAPFALQLNYSDKRSMVDYLLLDFCGRVNTQNFSLRNNYDLRTITKKSILFSDEPPFWNGKISKLTLPGNVTNWLFT
jgi:hypothetical protein